jgi:hypothetical protein
MNRNTKALSWLSIHVELSREKRQRSFNTSTNKNQIRSIAAGSKGSVMYALHSGSSPTRPNLPSFTKPNGSTNTYVHPSERLWTWKIICSTITVLHTTHLCALHSTDVGLRSTYECHGELQQRGEGQESAWRMRTFTFWAIHCSALVSAVAYTVRSTSLFHYCVCSLATVAATVGVGVKKKTPRVCRFFLQTSASSWSCQLYQTKRRGHHNSRCTIRN